MEPVLVGHGFTFRPPYRVNVLLWVIAETSLSPAVDVIEQLRSLVEARDCFGGVLRPPLSVTVIAAPSDYPTGYSQGIEFLAGVEDM
jgi:hypothetical protein